MKQAEGFRNYAFLDDRPFAARFFLAQLNQWRSQSRCSETRFSTSFQGLEPHMFVKNRERLSVCA
ncbi:MULTISPECIES: hypothetical protein [unclassified Microcoleus]|uniref:hypothetical protein n=1 Tax=unclassified Microcoleus TaxID=2642155 RepID=UPI002FCFC308